MAAGDSGGRAYTTLGIIAVGQGGGNIAIQFLTRKDNPGIDERVVLVNTNDTDIRRTIEDNEADLAIDSETLFREHVEMFGGGASVGVGNDFFEGERLAEEDFETIFRPINNKISGSEALMYTVALGGGSGNGSVPYIIDQLSAGPEGGKTADMNAAWLDGITQFALGAWPFDYESAQRHYNAICGLSRLLMREDGEPNADMTILASNTRLKELALQERDGDRENSRGEYIDDKTLVNERIIDAIDLFISAGRLSESTIDVKDYVEKPQLHGAYHGTFGTAMEKHTGLDIDNVIETAVENAFVPLDPSTAKAAYVIVRAPERKIQSGEVTMGRVGEGFAKWKAENGLRGSVGMETLAKAPGRRNLMDVLVFLAGFDLGPLFEESWEFYETEKEGLSRAGSTEQLTRVEQIEQNLRTYRNRLEE